MTDEKDLKAIPYGVSDFRLIREGSYYVDKTGYIRDIENKGRYLFFIRPRRFGKSLFLSLMEYYYDIREKDQFDFLFSRTGIHQSLTSEKSQYLVLKFNFARVEPGPGNVAENFLEHVRGRAIHFIDKYQEYLKIDIDKAESRFLSINSPAALMDILVNYCDGKKQKLYVIIDEYDNFANTILSSSGQQSYLNMTRGEGFLRSFFNVIKGGTTGAGAPISRLFMTGVSPITLDDVTSGFNIATNISLDKDINDMLGFTANEVETMIEYYRQTGKIRHSTSELIELMSYWYNHYRFSLDAENAVFHTAHVLYFLREYLKNSRVPTELTDKNVRMDYNKLRHLVLIDKKGAMQTNGNFLKLQEIIKTGCIHSSIRDGFPIDEIFLPTHFISLLFFFGLLTIKGIDDQNTPILAIPNESIKQLFYDYISKTYAETGILSLDLDKYEQLIKNMAFNGDWLPAIEYISFMMKESLNIRDLLNSEKAHQVFWNVYLGLYALFCVYSEKEMNQGFADLVLEPITASNPGIKYSYIIELKYIKPADYEKEKSQEMIETLRLEAETQLNQYGQDEKFKKSLGQIILKKLVLIFSGNHLVYHGEVY